MTKLNPKQQIKRSIRIIRRTKQQIEKRLNIAKDYTFNVDSPRKRVLEKKIVSVEGWIIPKKSGNFTLRVRNNHVIYELATGLKRIDVAKSYPEEASALYSGFAVEFEYEDGEIIIELNNGKGYKKLYATVVQYDVEQLPAALFNKQLANNYPEHLNLMDNRQKFYYEDAVDAKFERHSDDPRLMAIYLPQFHPFKENEIAWGKGFTEWTNVTTGTPRFVGHQQPILPKDLGFYDLRLDENIIEQIELAKKYGIYGFSFYYYWFSGKKIMDRPLNSFLAHKNWDFNFTICWANENWTKRWDGRDSEVIIAQEYRDEDPLAFIKDVEDILLDPRYVCEDGKPVLIVYRASELKDPKKYASVWREYFKKEHNKELQLVSCLSFDDQDPTEYGFDAALDFAPLSAFFKTQYFEYKQFPYIDISTKLLDINFSGVVADFRSIALNANLDNAYDFPVYPCVTPSWDNDARKKGKGFVYQNSSPDLYAQWLNRILEQKLREQKAPLVFINAWNEWAEGAMIEPSRHLGHAVLNRTAEVLAKHSKKSTNINEFPDLQTTKSKSQVRLAVVVHLYYIDLWDDISKRLENITEPFDVFISLNERDKNFIPTSTSHYCTIRTQVLPNRGRDVLPFLYFARRLRGAGYDYVLKIHSKKSKHRGDGSSWFDSVLKELLPSPNMVNSVIERLSETETSIIGPASHVVSLKRHMGSNKAILENLLQRAFDNKTAKAVNSNPEKYPYIGGTMFWARLDTLDPILDLYLMPDDFQSEHGQIDGTTAHAIERMFGVVAKLQHKPIQLIDKSGIKEADGKYEKKYEHAP